MPGFTSQRIGLYVGLSLVLHMMLGFFWLKHDADDAVATKTTESTSISVGLQAAMAGAMQSSEAISSEATQEAVVQESLEAIAAEAPKEVVYKPLPEQPAPVESPTEDTVTPPVEPSRPLAETDVPLAQPLPDTAANPPDQTAKNEPPEPPVTNPQPTNDVQQLDETLESVSGHGGEDGSSTEGTALEETGLAEAESANIDNQYDLLVRQHLLENKQTPRVMGSRRMEEVITVEFTLDRNGNVLSHQLTGLSRVREFNQAGARLVERAMPFPQAPRNISWQERVYTIDVRYQIK